MKPMRKKPFQYLFIVAASVATIVLIKNCHSYSSDKSIRWTSNKTQRKSINYNQKDQSFRKYANPNPYPISQQEQSKNNIQLPYKNNNYLHKPKSISAKMAYELLQILWGKSKENRSLLLQKLQKDSLQLQRELTQSYEKEFPTFRNFNPNDSLSWFLIPGFSKKHWLSVRKYQERLGGFTNNQQIQEIPRLDTLFKIILQNNLSTKFTTTPNRKISQQSTWKELYQHPYIGPKYAKIIYYYYQTHPEPTKDQISNLQGIPQVHLQPLLPYLSINCKD